MYNKFVKQRVQHYSLTTTFPLIIRNYLGHIDIKTTWGYILDNHRKEETARMILKSLENLNGLRLHKTKDPEIA